MAEDYERGGGAPSATGTSGVRVEDEGSTVVAAATGVNFAGAGVTVTDAGSNEALVTIPGGSGGVARVQAPQSGRMMFLPQYNIGAKTTWTSWTSAATSNNRVEYVPLFVGTAFTIDRIGIEVTTANGGASAAARLGIYNTDSNGNPTTVLLDAGTVSVTTTGEKLATVSQAIPAGFYLAVVVFQNLDTAGTNPVLRGRSSIELSNALGPFAPSPYGGEDSVRAYTTGVSGALGASPAVSYDVFNEIRPVIRLRAA
jgi:hypothetical protein